MKEYRIADLIVDVVETQGPIKAIDAALHLVTREYGVSRTGASIHMAELVQAIIDERRVVEVEYRLPGGFVIKSMLFPRGSQVRVTA